MAQYKVPQDVEADDKLLGPFNFRQFVYLMIAGGLIAACFPLFKLFPLLIIIPIPVIFFLLILALPLKKDQPMETYLSAVVSFHLKPHNRVWEPGEPENTIIITAPKKTDEVHLKNISQEEATHRLSFLADIVDTEGYAIKGDNTSGVRAEIYAEANAVTDIFEAQNPTFNMALQQTTTSYHNEIVDQMRNAIAKNSDDRARNTAIIGHNNQPGPDALPSLDFGTNLPTFNPNPVPAPAPAPVPQPMPVQTVPVFTPATPDYDHMNTNPNISTGADSFPASLAPDLPTPQTVESAPANPNPFEATYEQPSYNPSPNIVDLANNPDYSIETIAEEANRMNNKSDSEVFVSLH
jgi:hypothetical protein